jgi:Ala-tRNA(Pro) deacylase
MLHVDLSPQAAVVLRSILDAKVHDLYNEIAHTDARQFRQDLRGILATLEELMAQLDRRLAAHHASDDGARAPRAGRGTPVLEPGDTEHVSVAPPVAEFLRSHKVTYSVIHHRAAHTASREAAEAHVPGRAWAKAVVCLADGSPVLAVVPAHYRVDLGTLRELVGAQQLRLATEAEMRPLYQGCELGAMPPLGPLYNQQVVVDERLAANEEIAFSAGSHSDAIRMRYSDYAALVHPTVARVGRSH